MCIAQGVSPERGCLGVNTPRGYCVGLLAVLVGLYIIFDSRQGARTHCVHA